MAVVGGAAGTAPHRRILKVALVQQLVAIEIVVHEVTLAPLVPLPFAVPLVATADASTSAACAHPSAALLVAYRGRLSAAVLVRGSSCKTPNTAIC